MEIIIILVILYLIWRLIKYFVTKHVDKKRRIRLLEKYGDAEIVDLIMQRNFWQGQTPDQLIDSIGEPIDIDRKVLKTKVKETWKYHQVRKGQYALRIMLEDGLVVGWDKKS